MKKTYDSPSRSITSQPQMLTYNEKYHPNPELHQIFKDMAEAEAEAKQE